MVQISKRDLLKIGSTGVVSILGYLLLNEELEEITQYGGDSNREDGLLVSKATDTYQIDVARGLNAVPDPDIRPQLIYIVDSGMEKGLYLNVHTTPVIIDIENGQLVISESLKDFPTSTSVPQYIIVRDGPNEGVYLRGIPRKSEREGRERISMHSNPGQSTRKTDPCVVTIIPGNGNRKGIYVYTGGNHGQS